MSEASWELRTPASPLFRPELVVGAVSPLWGFFTGAALSGVAFWCMTRWIRPGEPLALATAHLRADPNLSDSSKDALEEMMKAAYISLRRKDKK